MSNTLPQHYSLAVGAAAYGTSVKTLRRRIADGRLRAVRSGKILRVNGDDLAALFAPVPAVSR